ncbi:MAG: hypothetical protein KA138_00095 [Saprospiraceae bacterium]|nr:hypothetical protein [Saprospiraceae bacterium]
MKKDKKDTSEQKHIEASEALRSCLPIVVGITVLISGCWVFRDTLAIILDNVPWPFINWRLVLVLILGSVFAFAISLLYKKKSYDEIHNDVVPSNDGQSSLFTNKILIAYLLIILSSYVGFRLLHFGQDDNYYRNEKFKHLLSKYEKCQLEELATNDTLEYLKKRRSKSNISNDERQQTNEKIRNLEEQKKNINEYCSLNKKELEKYIKDEPYLIINNHDNAILHFGGIESEKIKYTPSDLMTQVVSGKLSYFIPDSMKIKKNYIVRLGVSRSLNKNILVSIPKQSGETIVDTIQISSSMSISIIDPSSNEDKSFSITPISTIEQIVDSNNITYWEWYLMPLKTGNLPVIIRATYKIIDETGNNYRDVEVYKRTVYVYSDIGYGVKTFFSNYWQFIITSIISLLAISYIVRPVRDYIGVLVKNIWTFLKRLYLSITIFFKREKAKPKDENSEDPKKQ